jgi:hypothetical protein
MQTDSNAEEMKSLLLAQKQDHKRELDKRDQMITKLQGLFAEVQTKQAKREVEQEARVKELSDKHTNFIRKLKLKLEEVQQENEHLKG